MMFCVFKNRSQEYFSKTGTKQAFSLANAAGLTSEELHLYSIH